MPYDHTRDMEMLAGLRDDLNTRGAGTLDGTPGPHDGTGTTPSPRRIPRGHRARPPRAALAATPTRPRLAATSARLDDIADAYDREPMRHRNRRPARILRRWS